MVVIPAMLTGPASISELVNRLQLHYLANPERHAQFALLTDEFGNVAGKCSPRFLLFRDVLRIHSYGVGEMTAGVTEQGLSFLFRDAVGTCDPGKNQTEIKGCVASPKERSRGVVGKLGQVPLRLLEHL